MYQVEDEPLEVIHIYREYEQAKNPPLTLLVVSLLTLPLLALFLPIALGILLPSTQPVTRTAIRVPAVPAFTKTFQASLKIIPTGVKSYPATFAQGTLTFSNGSIIGQSIPAGFTVDGAATDRAVYVPPANAGGLGIATVSAHVVVAGINKPALSINEVIGTSLFVRNLVPFTGGHAAYSVSFVTPQDRLKALIDARSLLEANVAQEGGIHYPCKEDYSPVTVIWHCQFVQYFLPSYMHVLSVQLHGKEVVITVWYFTRPAHLWVK